jgi:hypothetical protein
MGADIYLTSVFEAHNAKHKARFEEAVQARNAYDLAVQTSVLLSRDPAVMAKKNELQEKVSEAYEAMYAEGYFRDSYNETSLFWMLGLSWWELGDRLLKETDEGRVLPIDKARDHLAVMEAARDDFDRLFKMWVKKQRAGEPRYEGDKHTKPWTFRGKGNTVADWRVYFSTKLDAWIALLKQSIELNEPLRWSI